MSDAGLIPAQILLDHRQRMYAYRLLTLPDQHPTKMILPISLRNGDRDSQLGEQPANTLLWTENARPILYGQRLAWQIALDHAIDAAEGVEPVELPETVVEFEGQVVIESPKKALEKAKGDCRGLALWTDGSKLDQGNVGAAVCWKDKARNQWKEQSMFLGKNKEALDAELWAILKALEVALKVLAEKEAPVTIFCDSQKALRTIQSTAYTYTLSVGGGERKEGKCFENYTQKV